MASMRETFSAIVSATCWLQFTCSCKTFDQFWSNY